MTDDTTKPAGEPAKTTLERALGLVTDVRPGESSTILLLVANIFLMMAASYILKTVREPLIALGGFGPFEGPQLKIYASAGQAILLLAVVPAYGMLASRYSRIRLVNITMLFFMACLGVFYVLAHLKVPLGLAFYLWMGIYNTLVIAQFWSYANDLYDEKQGKRLFPLVMLGQTMGAIFGPRVAQYSPLSSYELMLVGAAVLGGSMVLYNITDKRELAKPKDAAAKAKEEPLSKEGGFSLVVKDRYLLLIALLLLIANLVNTLGEYILTKTVFDWAAAQFPASDFPALAGVALQDKLNALRDPVIRRFWGGFYGDVNIAVFLIQALAVSRIFKYAGMRTALMILPAIAFIGYGVIGIVGGLAVIRISKIAENGMDYSLQNTVRQALFLPTSREAKYKAKAAIDTFFQRFGDTAAGLTVLIGTNVLTLATRHFAFVNVGLVLVWLGIAAALGREHRKLVPDEDKDTG